MKAYILCGRKGHYCENIEWIVAVFASQDRARAALEEKIKWIKTYKESPSVQEDWPISQETIDEFESHPQNDNMVDIMDFRGADYNCPEYHIEEFEVRE